jgi:plastocyanin
MTVTQRIVSAGIAGLLIAACNSSTSPSNVPPAGTLPPVSTTTITITSGGASPRNIEVALGSRVLFVNNDSRSHNMTSDPHPDHNDCPDLNQVGFLSPGERRETGNLVTARTCGYHDHDAPSQGLLTGIITIR